MSVSALSRRKNSLKILLMTFCIAIQVRQGILALADTEIVKGEERVTRSKLSLVPVGNHSWWIMTSGLRSIRDKAITYLQQELSNEANQDQQLFELANRFGNALRRVRKEDGESLSMSGLAFNSHAILGGQLQGDPHPKLYYIYPEGNWIEATPDTPYFIVGRTHYAKPILDRLLTFETSLRHAASLAFLAFDMTRTSVYDVDFPIDFLLSSAEQRVTRQHRYQRADLEKVSSWWNETLSEALRHFPSECFAELYSVD